MTAASREEKKEGQSPPGWVNDQKRDVEGEVDVLCLIDRCQHLCRGRVVVERSAILAGAPIQLLLPVYSKVVQLIAEPDERPRPSWPGASGSGSG